MSRASRSSFDKLDPTAEWALWTSTPAEPWSARWAAHLYRRAAFGPTRDELRSAVAAGMERTVDKLFGSPTESPKRESEISGPPPVNRTTGLADSSGQAFLLRAAWIGRLLEGGEPLREKLALFWHNHFATSIQKVNDGMLMERQGDLLFRHALGSFRSMIREIARDPAMLVWLDSNQNVKSHPNENFAREVMELFTLGTGHYTEKDVRDAARAFTGWHQSAGTYTFVPEQHDSERKTVLGQSGNWDGDDVLRILLEQPACARFLVRKLYQFLVNENATPPDTFLDPLVASFRKSDYDIAVPVRTILCSRHFYSAHAYRQKVKSPVEYTVGVVRMVGVGRTGRITVNPYSLLGVLELMGQQLYAPPNVKGWEGGRSWLNTATVLARHNFAHALVNGLGSLNEHARRFNLRTFFPAVDPLAIAHRLEITEPAQVVDYFADLLLPGDCRADVRAKLVAHIGDTKPGSEPYAERCRDAVFVLLTLPEYQLN